MDADDKTQLISKDNPLWFAGRVHHIYKKKLSFDLSNTGLETTTLKGKCCIVVVSWYCQLL